MNFSIFFLTVLLSTGLSVKEVELVTVTDTSFTVTWTTEQAVKGAVQYGLKPENLVSQVREESATRFHYVSVTGLAPDQTYYYRLLSKKESWPPPPLPAKKIKTLAPPGGRLLFTFAVMNDVHVGEDIDGLMVLPLLSYLPPLTPGLVWRFPVVNYWEFSLRSAVASVNQSGAELCIVNGDLTSWFSPEEFRAVKSYLDQLKMPYYVTRGNHDRVGDYPEDYFKQTFGLDSSWYSVEHKGFRFVLLDDNRLADGWNAVPEEEWSWLSMELRSHPNQPTFIFSHRPISLGGVDVDKKIQARFLKMISEHPQVVAVFHAHTHQARVEKLSVGHEVLSVVVPAVKNYPCGYGLVRVYESGLMYNFIQLSCPDCREWTHITRGENYGSTHRKALGKLSDRNYVFPFSPPVQEMVKASPSERARE